jgi:hypothetical protein
MLSVMVFLAGVVCVFSLGLGSRLRVLRGSPLRGEHLRMRRFVLSSSREKRWNYREPTLSL